MNLANYFSLLYVTNLFIIVKLFAVLDTFYIAEHRILNIEFSIFKPLCIYVKRKNFTLPNFTINHHRYCIFGVKIAKLRYIIL